MFPKTTSPDGYAFHADGVASHSLDDCVIINNILLLWLNVKKAEQMWYADTDHMDSQVAQGLYCSQGKK